MINELLVFQEHIFPESTVQNVLVKKEEISKINFFGEASIGTKLQKEFQSQQIKRINWIPFPFTAKCESNPVIPPTPGPKGVNWSVIVLPKFSSAAGKFFFFLLIVVVCGILSPNDFFRLEFSSTIWLRNLNQACKNSRAVFVLSFEEEIEELAAMTGEEEVKGGITQEIEGQEKKEDKDSQLSRHSPSVATLVSNAVIGSLFCAQDEFPQVCLMFLRFSCIDCNDHSNSAESIVNDHCKTIIRMIRSEAVAPSPKKRLEVFVSLPSSTELFLSFIYYFCTFYFLIILSIFTLFLLSSRSFFSVFGSFQSWSDSIISSLSQK
jgi:hypothetical protein